MKGGIARRLRRHFKQLADDIGVSPEALYREVARGASDTKLGWKNPQDTP